MENWQQPIVVGGTGLYFKALTNGLVNIPDIPSKFRKKIRKQHKRIGQRKFFEKLIKIDPLSKKRISFSDSQRSIRAYEVKKFTKKSLFSFIKNTKPKFNNKVFIKLFINAPRDLLKKKIEERVEQMFKDGAIQETKKFLKMKINKELSANKIIGINEIKDYLLELISKGIHIIPNSSKTEKEILSFNQELGADLPYILENGSAIHGLNLLNINFPNKIILSREKKEIIEIFNTKVPLDLKNKCEFISQMNTD